MPLNERFLPAFVVTLERLAKENLFTQEAADECPDGHPYYWNQEAMRVALVSQLGRVTWPLPDDLSLSDSEIIEYVEAIYALVSAPTSSWDHPYCGNQHPEQYDRSQGRYAYTVEINRLFDRFAPEYRMGGGRVARNGSPVLNRHLDEPIPPGTPPRIRELVTQALEQFSSSDSPTRWQGVRNLADAYEVIKSVRSPHNKREGTEELVKSLAPLPDLEGAMGSILKAITEVSNSAGVRHLEMNKPDIRNDAELLDFLFYMYFNVIRFSLARM